jgi:inner membrane protein
MDIITHIALGTVIGEIVLGKKAGKKALLWGAISGIIPDFDTFFIWFLEPSRAALLHRGFTHSLLFLIIVSPLFGWFISSLNKNNHDVKPKHWAILIFINGITHVILDLFTNYGTGFWLPFSQARYAFSTIAIIDIFFSLPLFFAMFWLIFSKRDSKTRIMIPWFALFLSFLYLPYTVINKAHANSVFENALHRQKLPFFQVKAYPQLPSNFLWLCIAKTKDGYWTGYYNQLQKDSIHFRFIPKNDYWLLDYENNPKIQRLKRFSKNEYSIVHTETGDIIFSVLRFGWLGTSPKAEPLMSYQIIPKGNDIVVVKRKPALKIQN